MSSQAVTSNTEAAILARLIQSRDAELAPEVARYLLAFEFDSTDVARMNELAERAQLGQSQIRNSQSLKATFTSPICWQ
jgi:hypothetical protein